MVDSRVIAHQFATYIEAERQEQLEREKALQENLQVRFYDDEEGTDPQGGGRRRSRRRRRNLSLSSSRFKKSAF